MSRTILAALLLVLFTVTAAGYDEEQAIFGYMTSSASGQTYVRMAPPRRGSPRTRSARRCGVNRGDSPLAYRTVCGAREYRPGIVHNQSAGGRVLVAYLLSRILIVGWFVHAYMPHFVILGWTSPRRWASVSSSP